jgi:hypothetical protein
VLHCCVLVVRAARPWPGTGLWWGHIGQAHALPAGAAKTLEPRPFVFEAACNELVGAGAAEVRELADSNFAYFLVSRASGSAAR